MNSTLFLCVNCGAPNDLGDCCPDCASFECDRCDVSIAFDEDILVEDQATGDCEHICSECFDPAVDTAL